MTAKFLLKPLQTLETFFVSRQEGRFLKETPEGMAIKEWLNTEAVAVVVHQDHYEIILTERPLERIYFQPDEYSLWVNDGKEIPKEEAKRLFSEINLMAICKAIDEEDFRRRGALPSRKPRRHQNKILALT